MIKGVNKQIVVVSCKNDIFEEAIFILKPQKYIDGKTICEEAQRVIEERTSAIAEKRFLRKKKDGRRSLFGKLFDEY